MDAGVVREFGMEGGGEDVALAQAHHVAIDFGFDRSLGADRHHVGSTDEHQRKVRDALWVVGLAEISDGLEAAELTTVSIAAHYSVERAEVDVLIIVELLGQQNHASAGAKHRFAGLDVGGDRLEQAGGTQEFALRGGFAARQDDPVDGFIEILGRAQQLPRGAESCRAPPHVRRTRPARPEYRSRRAWRFRRLRILLWKCIQQLQPCCPLRLRLPAHSPRAAMMV